MLTIRHASLAPLCADALQRERRQMQSKHLWYNIDINWEQLDKKLQVLAPTGLNREEIWKHLFITKHRQNPFVEGRYSGADYEEVKQKWEATKLYFLDYKSCSRPLSIDLAVAIRGFDIDNMAAQDAIDGSKALHARRWQTKDGTYRLKRHALPDIICDDAVASSSDAIPQWQDWDDDYTMGY